jgi:uncharacterized membrane protein
MKPKTLNGILAGFSAVGAAILAYLTRVHYLDSGSSVCDFSSEFSCDIVNKSQYAEIYGIPLSILGIGYFLTVIALVYWKDLARRYTIIVLATVFSLVFSLYLSLVEQFIIDSVCLFCETSKLMMVGILVFAVKGLKDGKEALPKEWIVAAIGAGLVMSTLAYLFASQPETKEDYGPLVACLNSKSVVMYGSFVCPACAKQKRILGEAAAGIAYVECDPRGPNPQAELCIQRNIAKTPTWILEPGGQEQKRVVGTQTPEKLAEAFGCAPSP